MLGWIVKTFDKTIISSNSKSYQERSWRDLSRDLIVGWVKDVLCGTFLNPLKLVDVLNGVSKWESSRVSCDWTIKLLFGEGGM